MPETQTKETILEHTTEMQIPWSKIEDIVRKQLGIPFEWNLSVKDVNHYTCYPLYLKFFRAMQEED